MEETYFGRCLFLSWYCDRGTCTFCFRSTTKHKIVHAENARRSIASVLADAIIGNQLGWRIEFLTGGYGIFEFDEIVKIAKYISEIYNEKIWINLGVLKKDEMIKLQPYVEGICASIETINPILHKKVCPDKDIEPYVKMLKVARELDFKAGMTIVIGLGETKEDFPLLKQFIDNTRIDRITFYALKPVKGTEFENVSSPDGTYYSWWIKQTRDAFPDIKIMAGLTPKKVDYVKEILKAGTDGITKFPAVKQFNSEKAQLIEKLAKEAGRKFSGSLTEIPHVNWDEEIEKLDANEELKKEVKYKLEQSLTRMKAPKQMSSSEEVEE